jgi:hypothetical protein
MNKKLRADKGYYFFIDIRPSIYVHPFLGGAFSLFGGGIFKCHDILNFSFDKTIIFISEKNDIKL